MVPRKRRNKRDERLNPKLKVCLMDGEFVSTSDVCAVTVAISVGGVSGIGAPLASALKLNVAALNTTGSHTRTHTLKRLDWWWVMVKIESSSSKMLCWRRGKSKLLTCQSRRHQCPRHWQHIRTGHQQVQAGAHSIWPNSRIDRIFKVSYNY